MSTDATPESPTPSARRGAGDEAIEAATGRPWPEWLRMLREAGAADWPHPEIAGWLAREHAVPDWWAQSVTVRFEQEIGRRLPGQRSDGTFEVAASRTLPVDPLDALDRAIAVVGAVLGEPASVSRGARHPQARWRLEDGTRLLATASPRGAGKTALALTHARIADPRRTSEARARLRDWLAAAD